MLIYKARARQSMAIIFFSQAAGMNFRNPSPNSMPKEDMPISVCAAFMAEKHGLVSVSSRGDSMAQMHNRTNVKL